MLGPVGRKRWFEHQTVENFSISTTGAIVFRGCRGSTPLPCDLRHPLLLSLVITMCNAFCTEGHLLAGAYTVACVQSSAQRHNTEIWLITTILEHHNEFSDQARTHSLPPSVIPCHHYRVDGDIWRTLLKIMFSPRSLLFRHYESERVLLTCGIE